MLNVDRYALMNMLAYIVRHRKLNLELNVFFSIIVVFQLILVAKGTNTKNLLGAQRSPLGNFRYPHIFNQLGFLPKVP